MQIEYRVKPQGPILQKFYDDRSSMSFIMGPLGSGKTTTTCQRLFKMMCEQEPNAQGIRPTRIMAVRNTYPDLKNTTIKEWRGMYEELGQFVNSIPPEHRIDFKLEDGTTVKCDFLFLSMDSDDDIKKLRGSQITFFWANETKELPKSVIDMMDLRHGRYPTIKDGGVACTNSGIIGDTNAAEKESWFGKMVNPDKKEGKAAMKEMDIAFFKQPGGVIRSGVDHNGRVIWKPNENAENINNLPKRYYIRGMRQKSDDWIAVELANEWGYVRTGKPVYPEFLEDIHSSEGVEYIEGSPIYRGWDFGLTPACVFTQITPTGKWQIIDEMCAENMGADEFSQQVVFYSSREYPNADFIDIGDPAGEQRAQTDTKSCFQILRANGVDIEAGTQDPYIRVESVKKMLNTLVGGRAAFILNSACIMLLEGFKGKYCFRKMATKNEQYTDKPDKNKYSHIHDALQYIAAFLFGEALTSKDDDSIEEEPNLWLEDQKNKITGY